MKNTIIYKAIGFLSLCLVFQNTAFALTGDSIMVSTGWDALHESTEKTVQIDINPDGSQIEKVEALSSTGDTSIILTGGNILNEKPKENIQIDINADGPQIEKVETISNRHVRVIFNEGVLLLDANPEIAFSITPYNDTSNFLEIIKAEYEISDIDLKTIILTTEEQEFEQSYIVTSGINLTNFAGNPVVSGVYDTGFFIGTDLIISDDEVSVLTEEVQEVENVEPVVIEPETSTGEVVVEDVVDTTAPENITDLLLTQKLLELNEYLVTLTWTPSLNTAGDLIDQILYKSLNRGQNYDNGLSLGANATKYETKLEGGKEYTFKITTKDQTGNESTGVIKSIRLPQTGPAGIMLITSMLSGLGATQVLRRKKK